MTETPTFRDAVFLACVMWVVCQPSDAILYRMAAKTCQRVARVIGTWGMHAELAYWRELEVGRLV